MFIMNILIIEIRGSMNSFVLSRVWTLQEGKTRI